MTAAMGMTSMIAARRMSLTTITSLLSQRSTNVPAIGLRSTFGSIAAKKTSPVASTDPVAVRHDRDECQLVEPVAEQRDELARPQRGERAVEGEADVWMLADPLDRLGRWPRDRDRDGVGRGRRAELEVVEGRRGRRGRGQAGAGAAHGDAAAAGRPADRMSARGRSRSPRHPGAAAISGVAAPDAPGPPRGLPPRAPAARERRRRTGRTPGRGSGRHRRSMPRSG